MGGGIASVGPTPKKVLAVHPVFNSALLALFETVSRYTNPEKNMAENWPL